MTGASIEEVTAALVETARRWSDSDFNDRVVAVGQTVQCPNTFTEEAIEYAVDVLMARVTEEGLRRWIRGRTGVGPQTVAVLNAGNVPLVGMQDLLSVLMTGYHYMGVLSSKSPYLLPAFSRTLQQVQPGIAIEFDNLEPALLESDRLMATGADATVSMVSAAAGRAGIDPGRQLLRGTRFSVAVIDGNESEQELYGLALDALLHEGRGCLNASIIFAPATSDTAGITRAFSRLREDFPAHPETVDILRHEGRFLEATRQIHTSGPGFVLVEGDPVPRRPGVVVWSRYESIETVEEWIRRNDSRLQTVIASERVVLNVGSLDTCEPGSSQNPPLDWRPDRIDAIDFLVGS